MRDLELQPKKNDIVSAIMSWGYQITLRPEMALSSTSNSPASFIELFNLQ